jgi:uncharacterized protein YecT (DUF1311 family)
VRRIILAVPVLASITALPAEAEMFGPGFQPCGDETSTLAVVECVQAKTTVADQRLNSAYKALQARIDAAQRQPLLAAQVCGSNTAMPTAASMEFKMGRSGRCRQPNAYAR